jgi:hypothetical protein
VSDIQGLEGALTSGSQAISPATLTVMAGNERILAILRALSDSNPSPDVAHALAQVTDEALTASSQSAEFLGQAFDASADSLDTLSFNSYIGPTLDRLDETALVLNDEANHPAARCTLKAASNKVLVAVPKGKAKQGAVKVKPGTISLRVVCSRAGEVKVTGTLTELIGRKPAKTTTAEKPPISGRRRSKAYRLGPLNRSVQAGKVLTLTLQLPAAAVNALGHGANESTTLAVTPVGVPGGARATTRIAALKAAR